MVVGAVLIVAGLALVWLPLGVIAAGLACVGGAMLVMAPERARP